MRPDTFAILPNLHVSWVIGLFVAGVLAWGAVIAWRWRQAHRESGAVYAARRAQGELAPHVDEAAFRAAYIRAEAPRGAAYFYVTALGCGLVVPPVMGVFTSLWREVWTLTGGWPPTAPGTMVHTFGLFLAVMGTMIAIAAFAMHRYHTRTPPTLRQAIGTLNATEDQGAVRA